MCQVNELGFGWYIWVCLRKKMTVSSLEIDVLQIRIEKKMRWWDGLKLKKRERINEEILSHIYGLHLLSKLSVICSANGVAQEVDLMITSFRIACPSSPTNVIKQKLIER